MKLLETAWDPRQPHGVQMKRIQSFEVCEDLCWQPAIPAERSRHSLPALLPKANYSCMDAGGPYAYLYPVTSLSLCGEVFLPRRRGCWKTSVLLLVTLKWPGLCQQARRAVLARHHPQPATAFSYVGRHLAPSLDSKSLQIYGPTVTHLMTPLISVGVSGQAKFGALFLVLPFRFRFSFDSCWPSTQPRHRLPTAVLWEPTSIFKPCLPRREVCLRLISTSFGIG